MKQIICTLCVAVIGSVMALSATAQARVLGELHASWYGQAFHGRLMADGNQFNMHDPTIVAHKKLPFGTILKLTNPDTDRQLYVIVQDRGPYVKGRALDLSYAAADELGIVEQGVAPLLVEIIGSIYT